MAKQKRAAKQTDKPVKRVRVLSVEVSRIGETKDEDKAARQRLRDLCEQVQQATNYVWMTWFRWHVEHDSPTLVREFVAARAAWHKGDRQGKEPKLDLKPVPNELSNLFYHGICEQWPELHSRVVVLLLNRLNGLIAKRKSANGSLPGWQSILLYRESVPSSTRPLPLPFDTPKTAESSNGNAKLQSPLSAEDSHRLVLKLARQTVPGKRTKPSVVFDCTIWDRGRQMSGRRITPAFTVRSVIPSQRPSR